MWSFGVHTNNIWRGNLSFIQGFDNLLDLICGSVLHASRSTMTWSVNRQFTIYMSLVWEIWQSNRLFHCQWVLKSRKELQSMLGLSKPLHETSKIYDELRDKKLRLIRVADKNESPEVRDWTSMLLQTTCMHHKTTRRFFFPDLFWAGVWKHGWIGRRTRALPARSKHTKTINITLSDSVLFFSERSLDSVLNENDQINSNRGRISRGYAWRHHIQASHPRAKTQFLRRSESRATESKTLA